MPDENMQEKLSATTSPNTVVMRKKRARTINNWPLIIAMLVIGVILAALVGVVVSRSGSVDSAAVEERAAPATELARNVLGPARGGVVEAPVPEEPEPPPVPQLPINIPEPQTVSAMPAVTAREREIEKPVRRESENERRIRELRFRQWEAALNSPIKVQHEEIKTSARSRNGELAEIDRQLAMLNNQGSLAYEQRIAMAQGNGSSGVGGGADFSSRNDLSRTQQFETGARDWTNPSAVEAPPTLNIIRTGSVIPATLVSGINSDLPGQIIGQVSQNVYDTPTGKHLLIPQGARLMGEYSSQVQYGQSRVFAVWQRIVFPDGKAMDLGSMPASSGAGYAGLRDRVNNHYVRIFGSAIMMSAILAGVEMTQDDKNDTGNTQRMSDALSESLGQVLGGVMGEMLSKNMSIAPTIEIRPGYRLNVMLVKDLVFPGPYRSFDYVSP